MEKSVKVVFGELENIDSLKEGENCIVNDIPGLITEVVNPVTPDVIKPGLYCCKGIEMTRGLIINGDHINLHGDAGELAVTSLQYGAYQYIDFTVEYDLGGKSAPDIKLLFSGRYSTWVGQSIYAFEPVLQSWKRLNYKTMSKSVSTFTVPLTDLYVTPDGIPKFRVYAFSQKEFQAYFTKMVVKVE